jgi:hypothetical protein
MWTLNVCNISKECLQRTPDSACKSNFLCEPVVEKCTGCSRVKENYCTSYSKPTLMWKITSVCPMASHVIYQSPKDLKDLAEKVRVGQQKSKKINK